MRHLLSMLALLCAATLAHAVESRLPQRAGPAVEPARFLGVPLDQSCITLRNSLIALGLRETQVSADALHVVFAVNRPLPEPFTSTTGVRLSCSGNPARPATMQVTLTAINAPGLASAVRLPATSGWTAMRFGAGAQGSVVIFARAGSRPAS